MLKFLLPFLGLLFSLSSFAFSLSKTVYNNADLAFIKHEGNGAFDSYLSMDVRYAPVKELFKSVVKSERKELKTRGEAHITVITPVEYFEVLKSKVSMKEINEIAVKSSIQSSTFKVICLGKGALKNDETYFIVVNSMDLLQIRKKVQKLFETRGGTQGSFMAEHFFPHITLGFTTRDLHEADGVIKNDKSCMADIDIL
ncbi:hypothetical protein [Peredibacter starrii]|uniref:Swiss Army Knife 2H phosphoesterase domain-containing protein n=1 Tax=Peredibacter starrii TaxID=28202 RepID=A0AAX4HNK1_9BACT|nr:hypothetical protein [Peredibacter starrii]WPU64509.1 hypothetical protein SOO65_17585 [Peredibacter starrii]